MKEMRSFIKAAFIVISVCFPQTMVAVDGIDTIEDPANVNNGDPEEYMNASQIIDYHGYPVEEYKVTTEDGYILTIQHIPHGKNNSESSKKRFPVFFQHGLLAASTCWIFDLPNKTLPFLLAERGYDVWLGNYRGNSYGREHTTFDPDKPEFWEFSFDQMGIYDLPSMINFILEKTGSEQLHYFGHSMGTTGLMVMLSEKTEFNDKVRCFHAFAPVARLDHTKAPFIQTVGNFADQLIPLLELLGGYEFLPNSTATELLAKSICKLSGTDETCSSLIFAFFGFDDEQLNDTRTPVYTHLFPAGSSAQTVQHYGQVFKNKRFAWFDYNNPLKNKEIYNELIPPLHDISKITTSVYLYHGDNDWLAQPEDVAYIVENLPKESLKENYKVPFEKFNHLDFLSALDVIPLLYEKAIENLENCDEMEN